MVFDHPIIDVTLGLVFFIVILSLVADSGIIATRFRNHCTMILGSLDVEVACVERR